MNREDSKKGFTIIEVVLVLAIAGLIFLMVFVALPALQRSQRDTARRNDLARVDTSLVQYQTNNQGTNGGSNLPAGPSFWQGEKKFVAQNGQNSVTDLCYGGAKAACEFVRDYMNSGTSAGDKDNEFMDPDGSPYSLAITKNWSIPANVKTTKTYKVYRGNNKEYTSTLTVNGSGDSARGTIAGDNAYGAHVIWIVPGGHCMGDLVAPSTSRHFAVLYHLEGAGIYCIDDQ